MGNNTFLMVILCDILFGKTFFSKFLFNRVHANINTIYYK